MAGRPRKPSIVLRSIDECTTAMGELLISQTELERMTAQRDHEIAVTSSKYEKGIDACRTAINQTTDALRDYYMSHLDELEKGGRRSFVLANGTIGRRSSPPKLTLRAPWTWAAVVAKVQSLFPGKYLRQRDPELDKDLVKSEFTPDQLKTCGMRLSQAEEFYAEPSRLPEPSSEVKIA